jgi:hypothetical protein
MGDRENCWQDLDIVAIDRYATYPIAQPESRIFASDLDGAAADFRGLSCMGICFTECRNNFLLDQY